MVRFLEASLHVNEDKEEIIKMIQKIQTPYCVAVVPLLLGFNLKMQLKMKMNTLLCFVFCFLTLFLFCVFSFYFCFVFILFCFILFYFSKPYLVSQKHFQCKKNIFYIVVKFVALRPFVA